MLNINTKRFCEAVTAKCKLEGHEIFPEQIRLALGGISNLYFEVCLDLNVPFKDFKTEDFFISNFVPRETILQEIENCTGTNKKVSKVILDKMKDVLYEFLIADRDLTQQREIEFNPIGKFQVNDYADMSFNLTYKDPASDHYDRYLLSKSI